MAFLKETLIRRVFVLGVIIKAFDGLVEFIFGILLFYTPALTWLTDVLVRGELIEDPNDFVSRAIEHYLPVITNHSLFLALYVGAHGVIKLFLAGALLKNRLWAYPVAIVAFSAFVAYQVYRYMTALSAYLIVLTMLDIFIIILTWHEWHFLRKHPRPQN